jgi:hypothetical protein
MWPKVARVREVAIRSPLTSTMRKSTVPAKAARHSAVQG